VFLGSGLLACLACGRLGYPPLTGAAGPAWQDALDAAAPDAAGDAGAWFTELTASGQTHCSEAGQDAPPGPGTALPVALAAGAYRLVATGGAINAYLGEPCWWSWEIHLYADGWAVTPDIFHDQPDPPICATRPWAWDTAAGAAQAAAGKAVSFSLAGAGEVGLYVTDSTCNDNIGLLEMRIEAL
jgi:hypothetical protein